MTSTKTLDIRELLTLKRIANEVENLNKYPEPYYQVIQDINDKFLFYFLLIGSSDSDYKDGYYIGKIVLPSDFPQNPGDFYMLTPSGRFATNQKICLTNSGYHRESWTPIWNIKKMVIAFISVFLDDDTRGISHIKESSFERKFKAAKSFEYNMIHHKDIFTRFDQFFTPNCTPRTHDEIVKYLSEVKYNKKHKKKVIKIEESDKNDIVCKCDDKHIIVPIKEHEADRINTIIAKNVDKSNKNVGTFKSVKKTANTDVNTHVLNKEQDMKPDNNKIPNKSNYNKNVGALNINVEREPVKKTVKSEIDVRSKMDKYKVIIEKINNMNIRNHDPNILNLLC